MTLGSSCSHRVMIPFQSQETKDQLINHPIDKADSEIPCVTYKDGRLVVILARENFKFFSSGKFLMGK